MANYIDELINEVEEREKLNMEEAGIEHDSYVESLVHENRGDFYISNWEDNYLYYNKK